MLAPFLTSLHSKDCFLDVLNIILVSNFRFSRNCFTEDKTRFSYKRINPTPRYFTNSLEFACCLSIDDFGVSDVILLGGANSGQTSIKFRDLACDAEPPLLKNCKALTMQLEVKYLFQTSFSGANFYIYELPEGLGIRKTLARGIRMQKNPQTREETFWVFTHFHRVHAGPCTQISSMASLTPKSSIRFKFIPDSFQIRSIFASNLFKISFKFVYHFTSDFRGSCLQVFCKLDALKNFAKFRGRHL